ncbi:MAG: hypothetical protein ACRDNT_21500, partial [Streptosporangiaceae bacterium]
MRRDRLAKEELDGFGGEHGAGHDARESGREPGWRLGDVAAERGEEPVAYFVAAGLVEPAADGCYAHVGLFGESAHALLAARSDLRTEVIIGRKRLGRVVT